MPPISPMVVSSLLEATKSRPRPPGFADQLSSSQIQPARSSERVDESGVGTGINCFNVVGAFLSFVLLLQAAYESEAFLPADRRFTR